MEILFWGGLLFLLAAIVIRYLVKTFVVAMTPEQDTYARTTARDLSISPEGSVFNIDDAYFFPVSESPFDSSEPPCA